MAILGLIDISSLLTTVINILYVALGLGLVIFFHELGHFAVAKWCDVNVERFSIGFGPILWSRKRGETEYALSAIPFGGYVKMLGQDDIDPSQLTSEEIARDPRSYSAKPVYQRMAIISAGVVMNVITALFFFAGAFHLGVPSNPAVLGAVQAGYPAWEEGLEYGDKITQINNREIHSFTDILRAVAVSRGAITIHGQHRSGKDFRVILQPNTGGQRRMIGAGPAFGLSTPTSPDPSFTAFEPASPAAKANPAIEPGDVLKRVGDTDVSSFAEVREILALRRAEPLELQFERTDKKTNAVSTVTTTIEPQPFRTFGLRMEIGPISAIRRESPAAVAGLAIGDKITHVNDRDVGKDIDPLRLPDLLASLHGQEVTIRVKRKGSGGEEQDLSFNMLPANLPGWVDPPTENSPVSAPSIGIAYQLIPTVLAVTEGSPAAMAGIAPEDRITHMTLTLPKGAPSDGLKREVVIDFRGKPPAKDDQSWAYAFWLVQQLPQREVTLTLTHLGEEKVVSITPAPPADPWYVPGDRGIRFELMTEIQRAETIGQALAMGFDNTQNNIADIYLTLRNLAAQELSYRELHGPIGIARTAYSIASSGLPSLLQFLGFLSVNLAVLNFLPIPILDGGHMVFLIWEAVTRRRPSERVVVAATYFGMVFVLGLMFLVLYLDIVVHWLRMS